MHLYFSNESPSCPSEIINKTPTLFEEYSKKKMSAAVDKWWLAASSWKCIWLCITSHSSVFRKLSHRLGLTTHLTVRIWVHAIFFKANITIRRWKLETVDEIKANATKQLMALPKVNFAYCFEKWKRTFCGGLGLSY